MVHSKPKEKKIVYKGKIYTCTLKNDKVIVRLYRTAPGQALIAGIYDIFFNTWQNEVNKRIGLPIYIKSTVEAAYA